MLSSRLLSMRYWMAVEPLRSKMDKETLQQKMNKFLAQLLFERILALQMLLEFLNFNGQ